MPGGSMKAMSKIRRLHRLLSRYFFLWENSNRKPTGHPDHPYESTGDALIHHLARFGPLDDLDLLILSGADVNLRGDVEFTPLHWAVITKNMPALRLLLRAGANPSVPDMFGRTALAAAQSEWSEEAAGLLAEAVQGHTTVGREDDDNPSA